MFSFEEEPKDQFMNADSSNSEIELENKQKNKPFHFDPNKEVSGLITQLTDNEKRLVAAIMNNKAADPYDDILDNWPGEKTIAALKIGDNILMKFKNMEAKVSRTDREKWKKKWQPVYASLFDKFIPWSMNLTEELEKIMQGRLGDDYEEIIEGFLADLEQDERNLLEALIFKIPPASGKNVKLEDFKILDVYWFLYVDFGEELKALAKNLKQTAGQDEFIEKWKSVSSKLANKAKNITLQGSFSHNYDVWKKCIKILKTKKIKLKKLITNIYALNEWKKAYNLLENRKAIKILLNPKL